MKILNAKEIKDSDSFTIQNEPISSIKLMERASRQVLNAFNKDYPNQATSKHIFCGGGNNGGDGLALARMLTLQSQKVKIYLVGKSNTPDNLENLSRLKEIPNMDIVPLENISQLPTFSSKDIIIDALLGSGLNKPLNGFLKDLIDYLNHSSGIKISIDIPTGLYCNQSNKNESTAFEANLVYTFHAPKLSFLLPENKTYVQSFKILDIGLIHTFTESRDSQNYYTQVEEVKKIYHIRNKFTHKGIYGHVLLIAGAYGKMGASILASRAALKSGSGLLTVHTPTDGVSILQTAFPEAMCSIDENPLRWTQMPDFRKKTIGIGPGIGTSQETQNIFQKLLEKVSEPIVLDADALNILSQDKTLIKQVPPMSILTPHPKEFERLVGSWSDDFERLEMQRTFSLQNKLIVVLKGAHTSISDTQGNIYFNSTGNNGMATAGSGDVLTGIITSQLAQGYNPLEAAILGVFIHGMAGNYALEHESEESLIASDIIKNIGKAFNFVRK